MDKKKLIEKAKIEDELGHKICGYPTKKGTPCKNEPVEGEQYCTLHLKASKASDKSEPKEVSADELQITETVAQIEANIKDIKEKEEIDLDIDIDEVNGRYDEGDTATETAENFFDEINFDEIIGGQEENKEFTETGIETSEEEESSVENIEISEEMMDELFPEAEESKEIGEIEKNIENVEIIEPEELLTVESQEESIEELNIEPLDMESIQKLIDEAEVLNVDNSDGIEPEELELFGIENEAEEEAAETAVNEELTIDDIESIEEVDVDEIDKLLPDAKTEENELAVELFDMENEPESKEIGETEKNIENVEPEEILTVESQEESIEELNIEPLDMESIQKLIDEAEVLNVDNSDGTEPEELELIGSENEEDTAETSANEELTIDDIENIEEVDVDEIEKLLSDAKTEENESAAEMFDMENVPDDNLDELEDTAGDAIDTELFEEELNKENSEVEQPITVENEDTEIDVETIDYDSLFEVKETNGNSKNDELFDKEIPESEGEENMPKDEEIPILVEESDGLDELDLTDMISGITEETDISSLKNEKQEKQTSFEDLEELTFDDEEHNDFSTELVNGHKPAMEEEPKQEILKEETKEESKPAKKEKPVKEKKPKKEKPPKKSGPGLKYFIVKNKYKILIVLLISIILFIVMATVTFTLLSSKKNVKIDNINQKMKITKKGETEKKAEEAEKPLHSEAVTVTHAAVVEKPKVEKKLLSDDEQIQKMKLEYIDELNKLIQESKREMTAEEKDGLNKRIINLRSQIEGFEKKQGEAAGIRILAKIGEITVSATPELSKVSGSQAVIACVLKPKIDYKQEADREKVYKDVLSIAKAVLTTEKEIETININVIENTKKPEKKLEITIRKMDFERIDISKISFRQALNEFDFYEKIK